MDGIALWLLFLVFLPFLLFFWKMLLIAWKSFLFTKKIKHLSDEMETRQNHLSTVSRSVDGNINYSNEERWDSDSTIKIDLPPTYEEVMKNFEDRSESGTSPNTVTNGGGSVETRDIRGMAGVEILIIPTSAQRNIL